MSGGGGMKRMTATRLRSLVSYSPETGVFTNRVGRPGCSVGATLGTTNSRGYVLIRLDFVSYRAHRLAWMYMTGKEPKHVIDHIDGNRTNNTWTNLRDVSQTTNRQNLHRAARGSASGLLGAHRCSGTNKWGSSITRNGIRTWLGLHSTPQEAHAAYIASKNSFPIAAV